VIDHSGETIALVSTFRRIADVDTRQHVIRYVRALAAVEDLPEGVKISLEFEPRRKPN